MTVHVAGDGHVDDDGGGGDGENSNNGNSGDQSNDSGGGSYGDSRDDGDDEDGSSSGYVSDGGVGDGDCESIYLGDMQSTLGQWHPCKLASC